MNMFLLRAVIVRLPRNTQQPCQASNPFATRYLRRPLARIHTTWKPGEQLSLTTGRCPVAASVLYNRDPAANICSDSLVLGTIPYAGDQAV